MHRTNRVDYLCIYANFPIPVPPRFIIYLLSGCFQHKSNSKKYTQQSVHVGSVGPSLFFRLHYILPVTQDFVDCVHCFSPVVSVFSLQTDVLKRSCGNISMVGGEVEGQSCDIGERPQCCDQFDSALSVDREPECLSWMKGVDVGEVNVVLIDVAAHLCGVMSRVSSPNHHDLANVNRRSESSDYDDFMISIGDEIGFRQQSSHKWLENSNCSIWSSYVERNHSFCVQHRV